MFMRISSSIALVALAACADAPEAPAGAQVECALGGAASFTSTCSMERASDEGTSILIVRHPDGGFRRFELGVAGRGLVTADGVEQAVTAFGDGRVEVSVGADRYLLPVAQ